MSVKHITENEFDKEVLTAAVPVIVDFWATWCGPCRMLAPVLEELAAECPQVKVVKLDVDNAPVLAARYNVMSIPYVVKFENGRPTASSIGYVDKATLRARLGV